MPQRRVFIVGSRIWRVVGFKGTGDVGDIASGANIKKLDDFSGPLENGPYIKNGKPRGRPQLSGEKNLDLKKMFSINR